MAYSTEWETLSAALARVVASGVSEEEAKADIANAIADGAISVRVKVDQGDSDVGGRILEGANVAPPTHLSPDDLEWRSSRPTTPWRTGPDELNPAERYWAMWGWRSRKLTLVELRRHDVSRVLLGSSANDHQPVGRADAAQRRSGGRPPKWDWAAFDREMLRIADQPDGLPDREALTRHMVNWCMENWGDTPSDSLVRDHISKRYPK